MRITGWFAYANNLRYLCDSVLPSRLRARYHPLDVKVVAQKLRAHAMVYKVMGFVDRGGRLHTHREWLNGSKNDTDEVTQL